jgi:uncharacterized protein YcfL
MKKFIIIIVLAFLQCACASSPGVAGTSASMLSFDAISAEITVSYENLEEQYEPSQAVAMNIE